MLVQANPLITRRRAALAGVLLWLLLAPALYLQGSTAPGGPTTPLTEDSAVGKLPLVFVPDTAQEQSSPVFMAHSMGGSFLFTPQEVLLQLPTGTENASSEPATLSLSFLGASESAMIEGSAALPGTLNYFTGDDPSQWRTGLSTYGAITYREIYPGIDLTYEGSTDTRLGTPLLKGTYQVAANADPSLIAWRYGGAQSVTLDDAGNLQIALNNSVPSASSGQALSPQSSVLVELAPVAWQSIGGDRVPVAASYKLSDSGAISFNLGSYDPTRPLTIDPFLTYSTYLGGNFAETGHGIAADSAGNFYVTGFTNSSNFPRVNALQNSFGGGATDAFVAKFNAQGQPVYITYLGGSSSDDAYGIAADADGNAYVIGATSSQNFPRANAFQNNYGGGFSDAFITKLNPSGSALVFSTYLGGAEEDYGAAIAIDPTRNIYVTGNTSSLNFPTRNPIQGNRNGHTYDFFITKLNPAASDLVWSTYLGGSDGDTPYSIAVDNSANVLVAGHSYANDYPVVNAFQPDLRGFRDAVLSKINAAGSALVFSTYWGGGWDEFAEGVDTDAAGNVFISGYTDSPNLFTLNAFQSFLNGLSDAFVAKFTPTGTPLYSTYLGGDWLDGAMGMAVNAAGEAFVAGFTQSDDFPLASPIDPTLGGSEDTFITRFSPNGLTLIFSTYLGGNDNRELQQGGSITIDAANTIYVSGDTGSTDFPTTPDAFQPFRASPIDAFISRISESAPPSPTPAPSPTACLPGNYTISTGTGSIVPGTTYLPNSACDNCTAPIVFPFPIRFYDQVFTQGRVGSEGTLQFTSNNALQSNFCLPYGGHNNTIFVFWDDLWVGSEGVWTGVTGTAPNRVLNIEWRGELAINQEPVNVELRLFENGQQFEMIYGQTGGANGDSATVGVQRDTGSLYTQYSCNQPLITNGLKLTFTLAACQTPSATPAVTTPTPTASPTALPPTLLYSTYFGSFERDILEDIAKDAAGNIYVMGTTFQQDIDYGDLWLAKFSPNGQQLIYQRIIGGTRIDYGRALTVDAAGNATIAGIATSNDYPLLNPIQAQHNLGIYDVVMTKFDPAGNMIFSTYLGGTEADYAERLQTDAAGNIYLTGKTDSPDWPTTPGVFQPGPRGFDDGYVTKITPNGSAIIWSTYLGGIYADSANDLALDAQGNIYLTGHTTSPDFPTLNAYQPNIADTSGDAFVTKMNSNATALIYSTYLGGSFPPGPGEDNGQGITVDAAGHAYVTGFTESPDFPTTPDAFQEFFRGYKDAFVTKFSPAGNTLVYSTLLGGTVNAPYGEDIAYDIAVDGTGQAHVTGKTYSPDFPIVNAVQPLPGDVYDAFVTKFNASGSGLVYSTFLGGDWQPPSFTGNDVGLGILIDDNGNAVITGGTASFDFPVVNPYQAQSDGPGDGFISKISGSNPALTPTPGPSSTPILTATPGPSQTATRTSTRVPTSQATNTSMVPTGTPVGPTNTPGGPTNTPGAVTSTPIATPTACTLTFDDVPANHTFYENIRCLACRGIISGYSDGTFKPGNDITRGQIAKMVSNAAGFGEPITGQSFEDVPSGSPFYDFIERLYRRGHMGGYQCGLRDTEPCNPPGNRPYFRPNENATRGQVSKIVSNAAEFNEPVSGQFYTDVDESNPFYSEIMRLTNRVVMSGYPCGGPGEPCDPEDRPYFRWGHTVTRGQASKIVSNTFFPGCETP